MYLVELRNKGVLHNTIEMYMGYEDALTRALDISKKYKLDFDGSKWDGDEYELYLYDPNAID